MTSSVDARGTGLVIRIAERNSFFAADMVAGLRAAAPGADIAACTTLEAVGHATDHIPRASRLVVIASARLAEIGAAGLVDKIRARGGQIVVVQGADPDADVVAAGFRVMPSPFTDESLAALLAEILTPPT